jgi:four helix bundle protein
VWRMETDRGSAAGDGEQVKPVDGSALRRVTAYALAAKMGELVWDDAMAMKQEPLLAEVAPQLVRATGSIAANIAEGYAKRSARDRIRFYEYALGSSGEAESWYRTARRTLSSQVYDERVACLTSIRRLLLVMIRNERKGSGWNAASR